MEGLFPIGTNAAIADINQNGSYDEEDTFKICNSSGCSTDASEEYRNRFEKAVGKLGYQVHNQSYSLAELTFRLNQQIVQKYSKEGNLNAVQRLLGQLESLAAENNLPFDQEWATDITRQAMLETISIYGKPRCRYSSEQSQEILNLLKSAYEFLGQSFDPKRWSDRNRKLRKCIPDF